MSDSETSVFTILGSMRNDFYGERSDYEEQRANRGLGDLHRLLVGT